jgi:hypothetical protein
MTVVDLYTIQIIRTDGIGSFAAIDAEVTVRRTIPEIEENMNDLLPTGFVARIRRWNQPDNEGNDDE